MQVEDFAFTREEIVFDVEAVHGLEVSAEDGDRDQVGDGRGFAAGIFDGMEGLQADLEILLVLPVPLRHAGVEVKAVIVEAWLTGESFDLGAGFFLDVGEAY